MFECLVTREWCYLKEIRGRGLVGGRVSLGGYSDTGMWWSGCWGTALVLLTGNQPQDTREKQAKKEHSHPQSKWKHRTDIHHYRSGRARSYSPMHNWEAGEAPDVLVNYTVQICAAHTP